MILSLCTHLFSLQSIQFLFPVCVSFSLPWFLSSFVTNYEHSLSLISYKNEGGSLLWFFFWSRFFFFFEQKRPKPERLHQSHTGSRNFWSRFFDMMKWYNYDWLFFLVKITIDLVLWLSSAYVSGLGKWKLKSTPQ